MGAGALLASDMGRVCFRYGDCAYTFNESKSILLCGLVGQCLVECGALFSWYEYRKTQQEKIDHKEAAQN